MTQPKRFLKAIASGVFFLVMTANLSQRTCQADIGSDLAKVFSQMGSHTNTSEDGTYKDQSAGYYSGGSLFVRNQNRNLQPASVQMPSFNAGCGGIDVHMGGFSFIDSQQLVDFMRNIGSKATSYAFMLAVQSLTPQVYNVINELNALAQEVNQFNINSCEAASTMVGSVWPKSDIASKHLCQSMGSSSNKFSSWAASRHECGVGGKRDEVLSAGEADEKYKNILVGEYNLAWKAIQNDAFLSADKQLSELFMTLSGTLISRKTGKGQYELKSLVSLADQDALISALLDGGEASIYSCGTADQDQKCLHPTLSKMNITQERAFRYKVSQMLNGMVTKIYDDVPLTAEEKAFLNATKVPIYKILNVLTAYRRGQAPLDVQEYADLIALDIVHQYLIEILDIVSANLIQIREVQIDDTQLTILQKQLANVRTRLIARRHSAFERLDTALSLIQKTQIIERQVHHMMGTLSAEERD